MLKKGLTILFDSVDIREFDQVEKFVNYVKSTFGRIDILVNNAGGQFPIKAEFLNSKGYNFRQNKLIISFNAVIRNNLLGTWNMTIACAKIAFIPQVF